MTLVLAIASLLAVGSTVSTLFIVTGQTSRTDHQLLLAQAASGASIGLLFVFVADTLMAGTLTSRLVILQPSVAVAFLTVAASVLVSFFDGRSRDVLARTYAYALSALGVAQTLRGFAPGRFFNWGIASDLAAFVLVTALVGWLLRTLTRNIKLGQRLRQGRIWPVAWFNRSQASLALLAASLTTWVLIDFSFDGVGEGVALFGLSGRATGCTSALMLLGASILMAWQSQGKWRAAWQVAAILAGLLFTSSIGWARIAAPQLDEDVWLPHSTSLLISASMMTMMTRFGLARVLPSQSDWIPRARRLSPYLGGLAVFMLAAVLIQWI